MADKPVACASHDSSGIHTLYVRGWPGSYEVEEAAGNRVEVVAEKRHEDDSWTFGEPRGGVLVCRASPAPDGQPRRATHDPADGKKWQMVIKVPPAKRGLLIQVN
jgi:hypothetical protein